jgi:hypothetical protein
LSAATVEVVSVTVCFEIDTAGKIIGQKSHADFHRDEFAAKRQIFYFHRVLEDAAIYPLKDIMDKIAALIKRRFVGVVDASGAVRLGGATITVNYKIAAYCQNIMFGSN